MAARKSFLFDGKDVWVKKVNAHFDVTIGAYDGAEACEIVGLYLLNKLTKIYQIFKPEEIGIFRDDGLSVMRGSGPEKDKKRKEIIRIFKEENLNITWEINIKKVQFLDVLLDPDSESYRPYHKINSKLIYVARGSNHPRVVLDNIPEGINRRLSSISSNQRCFDEEKHEYQKALKDAGYSHVLSFQQGLLHK